MTYYDTAKNPSVFAKMAHADQAGNFAALYQSGHWKSAVSSWGREHLFASRLLCSDPKARLPIFSDHFPQDLKSSGPCIGDLIKGPDPKMTLADMVEPEIIQQCQHDSVGYVWAAMAHFLRAERDQAASTQSSSSRPQRQTRPPSSDPNFVPSSSFQIGSSPPPPTRSSSAEPSLRSESSVGYIESLSAPLVEDLTVRLASCFIRCVLNYAQPLGRASPLLHFRDKRQTYRYRNEQNSHGFEAIDDGGVQLYDGGKTRQVALLEGKRSFQSLNDGKPIVSDQVLAQMTGEILALKLDAVNRSISPNDFIIILATAQYIKFFHFEVTDDYIESYETPPTTGNNTCYLRVHSSI